MTIRGYISKERVRHAPFVFGHFEPRDFRQPLNKKDFSVREIPFGSPGHPALESDCGGAQALGCLWSGRAGSLPHGKLRTCREGMEPLSKQALGEGEQVVVPVAVGVGAEVRMSEGGSDDTDDGHLGRIIGVDDVEAVDVVLDLPDRLLAGDVPALPLHYTSDVSDVLMGAVPVWFVDACDLVLCHLGWAQKSKRWSPTSTGESLWAGSGQVEPGPVE